MLSHFNCYIPILVFSLFYLLLLPVISFRNSSLFFSYIFFFLAFHSPSQIHNRCFNLGLHLSSTSLFIYFIPTNFFFSLMYQSLNPLFTLSFLLSFHIIFFSIFSFSSFLSIYQVIPFLSTNFYILS